MGKIRNIQKKIKKIEMYFEQVKEEFESLRINLKNQSQQEQNTSNTISSAVREGDDGVSSRGMDDKTADDFNLKEERDKLKEKLKRELHQIDNLTISNIFFDVVEQDKEFIRRLKEDDEEFLKIILETNKGRDDCLIDMVKGRLESNWINNYSGGL